ncbi:MAG: type II toxin-antitoxin system HipA family toxin [Deltaproteobacteria bacterium]|nr:MAG: type II toxin-antitoxin system HipA family toxin [Deltaproteobacteria bacterium]
MRELRVSLQFADPVDVGVLVEDEQGRIYFEFAQSFLDSGHAISPYTLPARPGLHAHQPKPGVPLPGVFSDSRPDGWGLRLLHRRFANAGRPRSQVTPFDELAFLGQRAMGALAYEPTTGPDTLFEAVELGSLAAHALDVYAGHTTETLPALIRAGGSPGGVRPKALIGRRGDEVCIGEAELPEGFAHWLVKFARPEDDPDAARREAAWMALARRAGLTVADSEVLQLGPDVGDAFATRRFDRSPHRQHMLSAAGALNVDFRTAHADYHDLGRLCALICRGDQSQVARLVRLGMFNVVARNEDDHLKNLAWLYDGDRWALSPAYDLTYAPHASGHRQTAVLGGTQQVSRTLLLELGTGLGLRQGVAQTILDEVLEALADVESVLGDFGCTHAVSRAAAADVLAQVERTRENGRRKET